MVRSDFDSDGNIVPSLRSEPTFVMIQSSGCGHCQVAKPDFQKLADSKVVRCMTIQADGDRPDERAIAPFLNTIYPGFQGYPSYILFAHGRKMPYNGRRSFDEMRRFVVSNI